jgi:hypothetical protein
MLSILESYVMMRHTCILKMPGSILGLYAGYPEGVMICLQISGQDIKLGHNCSASFPTSYLLPSQDVTA